MSRNFTVLVLFVSICAVSSSTIVTSATSQNVKHIQVPTWNTTWANPNINATAGLPLIPETHYTIFNGSLENGTRNPLGTFNHGPQIGYFNNEYYVSWYNTPLNEASHQRVLYSTSKDGQNWNQAFELFPNITSIGSYNEPFLIINNSNNCCRIYGSASVLTPENGYMILMRQIYSFKNLSQIFWLSDYIPNGLENFNYSTYLSLNNNQIKYDMQLYLKSLISFKNISGKYNNSNLNQTASMYVIPNTRTTNKLTIILLIRDGINSKQRLYSSQCVFDNPNSNSNDIAIGGNGNSCRAGNYYYANLVEMFINGSGSNTLSYCNWSKPIVTNIPDAPARSCTSYLSNGMIYLVGNQIATGTNEEYRSVLTLSLSQNGYIYDKVYAVRYNPPPIMFPGTGK